jgi:metal-dependent amidase/aminoacylase/carboxypeptidase family protein
MVHPSNKSLIGIGGLATTGVEIVYRGLAAHSSSPEDGINALQAVIQTFNLVDSSRALMPLKTNINGIIIEGGTAANIITDYAKCEFSVRTGTLHELKIVVGMIKNIIYSVENLTGAKAEIKIGLPYAERYPNLTIGEIYKKYMEQQGEIVEYPDPNQKIGSSDIGNVTLKIPAIHAYLKIATGVIAHSASFTEAAISKGAAIATIKSSKALACTGYEILTDQRLRNEIKKEFDQKVPKYGSFKID